MEKASFEPQKNIYQPSVRNLMSTDLFTLYQDDNIETLDELMKWRKIRHVPIIDQEGSLAGLITHRDFLRVAVSELARANQGEVKKLYRKIPIQEIMKSDVMTVQPDTPLSIAADLLMTNKIGCLPVVENQKLVGIITEADFVKAFAFWDAQFQES